MQIKLIHHEDGTIAAMCSDGMAIDVTVEDNIIIGRVRATGRKLRMGERLATIIKLVRAHDANPQPVEDEAEAPIGLPTAQRGTLPRAGHFVPSPFAPHRVDCAWPTMGEGIDRKPDLEAERAALQAHRASVPAWRPSCDDWEAMAERKDGRNTPQTPIADMPEWPHIVALGRATGLPVSHLANMVQRAHTYESASDDGFKARRSHTGEGEAAVRPSGMVGDVRPDVGWDTCRDVLRRARYNEYERPHATTRTERLTDLRAKLWPQEYGRNGRAWRGGQLRLSDVRRRNPLTDTERARRFEPAECATKLAWTDEHAKLAKALRSAIRAHKATRPAQHVPDAVLAVA